MIRIAISVALIVCIFIIGTYFSNILIQQADSTQEAGNIGFWSGVVLGILTMGDLAYVIFSINHGHE